MTPQELKEKFPALYASIMEEGTKAGVTAGVSSEQNRVKGWNAFAAIDPEGVKAGIAGGKEITMAEIAEFSAKAFSPDAIKRMQANSTGEVKTGEEKNDASKGNKDAINALEAEVRAKVGLSAKAEVKSPMTFIASK